MANENENPTSAVVNDTSMTADDIDAEETSIEDVVNSPEFRAAYALLDKEIQESASSPPARRPNLHDEAFSQEAQEEDDAFASNTEQPLPEDETETTSPTEPAELTEPQLQRLIQAGRRAQLHDDKIIDLIQHDPSLLDTLANQQDQIQTLYRQQGQSTVSTPPPQPQPVTPTPPAPPPAMPLSPLELDLNGEELDDKFVKKILKPLQNRLNELSERLAIAPTPTPTAPEAPPAPSPPATPSIDPTVQAVIDGFFDKLTNAHPQFGVSTHLTPQAGLARRNVCMLAHGIGTAWNNAHPDQPMTMEQALQRAIHMETGEAAAIASLIKKIRHSQKRLTMKPTARQVTKKHATPEDEAADHVDAYLREHGITA